LVSAIEFVSVFFHLPFHSADMITNL
jgi:hypothetical protein